MAGITPRLLPINSIMPTDTYRRVLVLEGGGPIGGAYQAGVYYPLAQLGFEPEWVAATSIGAVNAAIVAGNEEGKRVERLKEFWDLVTTPSPWQSYGSRPEESTGPRARSASQGQEPPVAETPSDWPSTSVPGFFTTIPNTDPNAQPAYDTRPLYRTLERLTDFDRINDLKMRLSVQAVDVESNETTFFDNYESKKLGRKIGPEHILAAIASPPGFPPTEIDGKRYRGGNATSRKIIDYVIQDDRRDILALQVGVKINEPSTIDEDESFQTLPSPGRNNTVNVVHLTYRPHDSIATMSLREKVVESWNRGASEASRTLLSDTWRQEAKSRRAPERPAEFSGTERRTYIEDSTESSVTLLFATTRKQASEPEYFSGERETGTVNYGKAKVHVPRQRALGQVNLPFELKVFGLTLYKQAEDPDRHFILKGCQVMQKDEWLTEISTSGHPEALVFVHGYNVTFLDGVYRCAQIAWDIRYPGIPILFSWASRGSTLDYLYDRDSAEFARPRFVALLGDLRRAGIQRVHILAHSMGNFSILSALANHPHSEQPLGIGELLMAAPDVDTDVFLDLAPRVRRVSQGMTLYASSTDRAMAISKKLARRARAGDVPDEGPIILDGIDTIDVTAIGDEILGLNHSTFASSKSILNDVKLLLTTGIRPPGNRLAEIQGMPTGQVPSKWWRYVL